MTTRLTTGDLRQHGRRIMVLCSLCFAFAVVAPASAQDADPPAEVEAAENLEEAAGEANEAADELAAAGEKATEAADALKEGDFNALWESVKELAIDYGPSLLGKLVLAIVILVVGLILAKWIAGLCRRAMTKARVDETLARFLAKLVKWALLILVAIVALSTVGIPVTGFAAVIAAAGFAIGLALSGTLGNFAAGVMLLIFRPFTVGDVVNAAGITAKCDEIELFTTTFITPDNRKIIVPNGEIFGGTIENVTAFDTRRVDVTVGCSYDADIDRTKQVLQEAIDATENILSDPATQIYLSELGGSSVDYAIRVWAKTADYWGVKESLTRNIKYKLDAAGIGIPYPQMDVHLDGKLES